MAAMPGVVHRNPEFMALPGKWNFGLIDMYQRWPIGAVVTTSGVIG
jgi:hypothetical protein